MKTYPSLVWDEDMQAEIHSLQELNQFIDMLVEQGQQALPFSAQLSVNPDTSLLVTVGSEVSHLEFFSHTGNPLVVGCRGPWDDDTLVAFTHGGEYSEIERRYCVPFPEAREAVRQYFLTGKRPTTIAWNDA